MADRFTLEWQTDRFERFTRNLVRGMERKQAQVALRKTAFDLLAKLIPRTPVDTGRARAGWTPFLIARGRNIAVGGSDPQAQQEGRDASFFEEKFRGREQFIIIGNGVRYIFVLEFGGSQQAPAGMLRLTMQEMRMGQRLTKELRDRLQDAIIDADRQAGRTRGTIGAVPRG